MEYEKGQYYHLYNRGINKKAIFFNDDNYLYLIKKVKKTYKQFKIKILAYCLMPNHYHFMVHQETEIPVSKWLQNIFNGYVQAVNLQQNRVGTLFQGKTKSRHIDNQKYLLNILRYIHLNPLKAGLVKKLEDWPYSNYLEWAGIRKGKLFNKDFFDIYFSCPSDYIEYIEAYTPEDDNLEYKKYLIDDR